MKNRIQSIHRQAERFAEITKTCIRNGNISRAKKCLAFAEQLLVNGSHETKSVISNTYVYSVSAFMELRNCRIANLLPAKLRQEYLSQINAVSV